MRARSANDIGLIIRERRRKLHLDQAELAGLAKVSRQWIIDIEKGKSRAEIGLVLGTLAALGLVLTIDMEMPSGLHESGGVPFVDIDAIIDNLGPSRP